MYVHVTAHICRSEDDVEESALSLHHVGTSQGSNSDCQTGQQVPLMLSLFERPFLILFEPKSHPATWVGIEFMAINLS